MWYFAWSLGLGFAATLGILNAIWFELKPYKVDGSDDDVE